MVTDFGYGSNWYLDQDKTGAPGSNEPNYLLPLGTPFGANAQPDMYTRGWYEAWSFQSLLNVSGQLTIPSGASVAANIVDASTNTSNSSSMSLASFLGLSSTLDFAESMDFYFATGTAPSSLPIDHFVTGGLDAENVVYIGAPTAAEIKALAPSPNNTVPWVEIAGASGTTVQGVSGLASASGTSSSFVTNTSTVVCNGQDVIIDGTLLLNNAHIQADNGGCRLYVTGAVFIEGPITYVASGANVDDTRNLQITSAEAIFLGVGLTGISDAFDQCTDGAIIEGETDNCAGTISGTPINNPLEVRLDYDARQPEFRSAPNANSYSVWEKGSSGTGGVLGEGKNIGSSLLIDASSTAPAAWGTTTATSYVGQTRTTIDYSRLLLNAPVIHSRYLGSTTGVVVGEIAEFSLGNFNFNYDTVFSNASVPILPALLSTAGLDILCVGSTGITCHPAQ